MTVKNTDLNSFTGQVCLTYYNMSSNPYDVCHIPEIQPIGAFTKLVPLPTAGHATETFLLMHCALYQHCSLGFV